MVLRFYQTKICQGTPPRMGDTLDRTGDTARRPLTPAVAWRGRKAIPNLCNIKGCRVRELAGSGFSPKKTEEVKLLYLKLIRSCF